MAEVITARRERWESTAIPERADITDAHERTDPTAPIDKADPTLPMERTEPIEAIDSTEPRLAIQRNDSSDHRDQRLVEMEIILQSCPGWHPAGMFGTTTDSPVCLLL